MNIATSAAAPYKPEMNPDIRPRRKEFTALENALKSGDMAAAQQALGAIQKEKLTTVQAGENSKRSGDDSQASKDMKALGDAIQGGRLPDAQAAFAQLKQDMRSNRPSAGGGGSGSAGGEASEPAPKPARQVAEEQEKSQDEGFRSITEVANPSQPGKLVGVILNKLA